MKKNFLQITLFLISVAFFAQEKNEEKKMIIKVNQFLN